MSIKEGTSNGGTERVGARSRSEVVSALDTATAGQGAAASQFQAGQAAAFEWALGRVESSPVTARGGRGGPDLTLLTAELDAVTVQLEGASDLPGNTDYLRGLRAGLIWLCGYHPEPG